MIKMTIHIALLACMFSINLQAQKFENLALTPPMGWSTWNTFKDDINENLIKEIADVFITAGYKDAGYVYINLDDAWMTRERDQSGNLVPDPIKFPSGIKALAETIHEKGLKIGIYGCAGSETCAGYPGNRDHEVQDARLYASWSIDYFKCDWCNTDSMDAMDAYTTIRDALYAAKRPVVLEICEWGNNQPWEWGKSVGHLWRTTGDITACWDCEVDHGGWSDWGVMRIINMRQGIRDYAGPGHWNHPDMLEVGNGMTVSEDRAHFSMWCMLAAPLIMGNDIRNATKETVEILTNKEVIAVDQDSLGIQAFKYSDVDSLEIWVKPLDKGNWAICFLNRNDDAVQLRFNWNEHQINDIFLNRAINFKEHYYKVRDLWAKKYIGCSKKILKAIIPSHDVLMVRLIQ